MATQPTTKNQSKALHRELLAEFKKYAGQGTKHSGVAGYLGNGHFSYHISNPVKWNILKDFVKKHKEISLEEFTGLLDILYSGASYDEKSIAGMLIGYYKNHRTGIELESLAAWIEELIGWAEIDSLCQSNFQAEELLSNSSRWNRWQKMLVKFSKDKNISKRRASLVLLTGPISQSADPRLLVVAFKNIDQLKSEKDILITKAISWLLRSAVRHHKKAVSEYLKQNLDSLPKIAIRETTRKILTGRK